jgi:hypothetical protein
MMLKSLSDLALNASLQALAVRIGGRRPAKAGWRASILYLYIVYNLYI